MSELTGSRRAQAELVNNFLNGKKQVTETDAALAIAYYPLLVDLATRPRKITFKDFVELAKATYLNQTGFTGEHKAWKVSHDQRKFRKPFFDRSACARSAFGA